MYTFSLKKEGIQSTFTHVQKINFIGQIVTNEINTNLQIAQTIKQISFKYIKWINQNEKKI